MGVQIGFSKFDSDLVKNRCESLINLSFGSKLTRMCLASVANFCWELHSQVTAVNYPLKTIYRWLSSNEIKYISFPSWVCMFAILVDSWSGSSANATEKPTGTENSEPFSSVLKKPILKQLFGCPHTTSPKLLCRTYLHPKNGCT